MPAAETSNGYFPQGGVLTADRLPSGESRVPFRPLGRFSDSVVTEMPLALERASVGRALVGEDGSALGVYVAHMESLAGDLIEAPLPLEGTPEFAVARLDVMMGYAGVAHSGERIGENVSELVRRFALGGAPVLTYADVVLSNPFDDPRTFTVGEVGKDEADFYRIHRDIEHATIPIVDRLEELLFAHAVVGATHFAPEEIEEMMAGVRGLNVLVDNTEVVGRMMQRPNFNVFRPYLGSTKPEMVGEGLEEKEYPGPSGAFTAAVPALDLLLSGKQVLDLKAEELATRRDYFPPDDLPLLDAAVVIAESGNSLMDFLFRGGQGALADVYKGYVTQLQRFRAHHMHAIELQIPFVLENPDEEGTGGMTDVGSYLNAHIRMHSRNLRAVKRSDYAKQN